MASSILPDQHAQVLEPPKKKSKSMPKVRLGNTNLMVSVPCLGGVGLGSIYGDTTDEQGIETVERAITRGMNLLDTSPLYGESERVLGLALQKIFASGEVRREDLIICSKVGDDCPPYSDNGGHHPMSKEGVRASVVHSLKLLQLQKLDICLLHDPTLEEVERFITPGQGGLDAFRELRNEGRIDFFGIGCVEHEQQLKFMEALGEDCGVVLSVNDYNLVRRYAATGNVVSNSTSALGPAPFAEAQKRGVGIMNAGAFYMGLLGDPYVGWSSGFKQTVLADKYTKTMELAQRMDKWLKTDPIVLEHFPRKSEEQESGGIPLRVLALHFACFKHSVASGLTVPIGCRTVEEVDQICDAISLEIPDSVWEAFEAHFDGEVKGLSWSDDHWRYDKAASKIK